MKISSNSGEFGFKGIVKNSSSHGWRLTDYYYFSLEDLKKSMVGGGECKWPVELFEDGTIYIPSEDELQ